MTDLRDMQVQWDAEGETIERGRPACRPVRPAGELSMLQGTALILALFALLPLIAAVLP